jgi:hypothetical protein
MGLKLGKLPDRTPVKITITLLPELNAALKDYAACYKKTYNADETVVDLVPFMLKSFLESDKEFLRWSKRVESERKAP